MENKQINDQLSKKPSLLKVRCPECLKLYSVNPLEIFDNKPKFACTSCESEFWFSYPECLDQAEIIGIPTEWVEEEPDQGPEPKTKLNLFTCPSCEHQNPANAKECGKCGVIFERFALKERNIYHAPGTDECRRRWGQVVEDYENLKRHRSFVKFCLKNNQLDYASSLYTQMLEVNKDDHIARQIQKELIALSSIHFTTVDDRETESKKQKKLPYFAILMTVSGFLVVAGFLIPGMRNLVGFGAALLFLVLAIKKIFK